MCKITQKHVPKMCNFTHFWHLSFDEHSSAFGRLAQKNLLFCKNLSINGLKKILKKIYKKYFVFQKINCTFASANQKSKKHIHE